MSRLSSFACIVFATGLLSACASTQTASTQYKSMMRQTQIDQEYVGYVNAIAKQRGTRVVWVNPPEKDVPAPIAAIH